MTTTEILIDPNVRVANNETFSGFEDVVGDFPEENMRVRVREPESNVVGEGVVTRIDENDKLVYIAVEWASLAPERLPTPAELLLHVQTAMAAHISAVGRPLADRGTVPSSQTVSDHWVSNRDTAVTV